MDKPEVADVVEMYSLVSLLEDPSAMMGVTNSILSSKKR